MPGQLLADLGFSESNVVVTPIDPPTTEGWYDPYMQDILPDNHQRYYQYDFYLDSSQWFFQDSGTVYWLGVTTIPLMFNETMWGWKSSLDHWNDNAVMEINLSADWIELFEPPPGGSLDMAFVITGEAVEGCDCLPGDADGDGKHLILDVTHLINYLYKNGPDPIPYATCSGDADNDCKVLILDVTYLINYLYKNGPAPGSCGQWLMNCGPLQK
jgi:hypothetical protein